MRTRILTLTEDETAHRREMEEKIVKHAFLISILGNICGLLAIASLGFLSYEFMIQGHATEGGWIAGSIAGVVGIFVIRR